MSVSYIPDKSEDDLNAHANATTMITPKEKHQIRTTVTTSIHL